MKSPIIRRLDFVLDKIESRDSKREVMYIHFGHPTKKKWAHGRWPWGLAGEEGRGKGRGRRQGGCLGRHGGLLLYVRSLLCAEREEELNPRKKEEREKKKKRNEKKKYGKFSKLENFRGEK
jgi:hypothetical protein